MHPLHMPPTPGSHIKMKTPSEQLLWASDDQPLPKAPISAFSTASGSWPPTVVTTNDTAAGVVKKITFPSNCFVQLASYVVQEHHLYLRLRTAKGYHIRQFSEESFDFLLKQPNIHKAGSLMSRWLNDHASFKIVADEQN